MSVKRWLKTDAARLAYNAVVVDPPRQGLEKEACVWLCDSRPKTLRYVSCDAATFARDASLLCANGFSIDALQLYDFYPQTSHVELLGIFSA
jgi:23S rRNA (uracil1939-C5)-methyltransferase